MKKTTKQAAATTAPISPSTLPPPVVTVEYDDKPGSGVRLAKTFEDPYKGRRFYGEKLKAGKNPAVVAGTLPPPKAKAAKATPSAAATPPQPAAKKEPKMSRPETAGRVLAAHGLDAKLDALVGEVDELYGQPNPRETIFCLRNAKNAIVGYLAATGK